MPLEPPPPLPPASVEAEESIIASLLVDDEALDKVQGIIQPDDFYRDQNRWAYEACLALSGRGEGINQITVGYEMAHHRGTDGRTRLEEADGNAFLSRLVAELPTPVGVESYARLVKRQAIYRRLISDATYLMRAAFAAGPRLGSVLSQMETRLRAAREAAAPALEGDETIMSSDLRLNRALCPNCDVRFVPPSTAKADDPVVCPSCLTLMIPVSEPPDERCFAWLTGQRREPESKAKPGHRAAPGAIPAAIPGPGPSPPANPGPRPPQPPQPARPTAAAAQLREPTAEELLEP